MCLFAPTQSTRRRALRDWGEEEEEEDDDDDEEATPTKATAIAGTAPTGCRVTSSKGLRYYRHCVQITIALQRVQLAYTISKAGGRAVLTGALLLPAVADDTWVALGINPGTRQQMAGTSALLAHTDASAAGVGGQARERRPQQTAWNAPRVLPALGAAAKLTSQAAPSIAGASVYDYYMAGTGWASFSRTTNFLHNRNDTLSAARVGGDLVATFAIYLPPAAAASHKLLFALGDMWNGTPMAHYGAPVITISAAVSKVSAAAAATAKVLNPTAAKKPPSPKPPSPRPPSPKPKSKPPPPKAKQSPAPKRLPPPPSPKRSPPSPSPPPPPKPTPSPALSCTLPMGDGTSKTFDKCTQAKGEEGEAYTLFFTVASNTLTVGMR